MTDPNDQHNAHDPDGWLDVFSGKRLPDPNKPDEQQADQARQVILWRKACRDLQTQPERTITPQQAESFYHYTYYRERQQQAWRRRRLLMRLWPILLVLLAALVAGAYWWHKDTAAPSSQTGATVAPTNPINNAIIPRPPPGELPEMLTLPGGTFTMGCTPGWDDALGGCRDNEYPAHAEAIAPFRLAIHEVTVGQFQHFVAATGHKTLAEQYGCTIADPSRKQGWVLSEQHHWRNPGFAQTSDHPVVCVSWWDAQQYTQWLSDVTGENYRLPSEAEWEYAARAGRITAFPWGSQAERHFANYAATGSSDQWQYTAPVGQFTSNAFGLHDMAGNVWEWTSSCWTDDYNDRSQAASCVAGASTLRVRRGGGWDTQPPSMRSAYRSFGSEVERSYVYGFRVAQDLDQSR